VAVLPRSPLRLEACGVFEVHSKKEEPPRARYRASRSSARRRRQSSRSLRSSGSARRARPQRKEGPARAERGRGAWRSRRDAAGGGRRGGRPEGQAQIPTARLCVTATRVARSRSAAATRRSVSPRNRGQINVAEIPGRFATGVSRPSRGGDPLLALAACGLWYKSAKVY
jgi:hypothetical protein